MAEVEKSGLASEAMSLADRLHSFIIQEVEGVGSSYLYSLGISSVRQI